MSERRTINEREFRELCDIVLNGRESIWRSRDSTKPDLDDKIALLEYLEQRVWDKVIHAPRLLVGDIFKTPAENFYEGIQVKVDKYGDPPFNSRPIIDDMLNKALSGKNNG
jgi:hypothetical protein